MKCKMCGKIFEPAACAQHAKYCPDCREEAHRRRVRENYRKKTLPRSTPVELEAHRTEVEKHLNARDPQRAEKEKYIREVQERWMKTFPWMKRRWKQ